MPLSAKNASVLATPTLPPAIRNKPKTNRILRMRGLPFFFHLPDLGNNRLEFFIHHKACGNNNKKNKPKLCFGKRDGFSYQGNVEKSFSYYVFFCYKLYIRGFYRVSLHPIRFCPILLCNRNHSMRDKRILTRDKFVSNDIANRD